MNSQSEATPERISVQAALANPMEMTLNPEAAPRILLTAVVDTRIMRPRLPPELAAALGLKVENIS